MHAHRPLPADSELARAITVLARAQQDAVWSRQQVANQVRSLLREYYPAALLAFQGKEGGLTRSDARVILTLAPTPAKAAKLTLAQLRAALKRSGRTRAFDTEAERLRDIFRAECARRLPAVEDAFGHQLLALLKQLDAACQAADNLAEAVEAAFRQHAASEILLSFPDWAPARSPCSSNSATIGTGSPTPGLSSPTPAPRRSPGPQARPNSSDAASSRTTAS